MSDDLELRVDMARAAGRLEAYAHALRAFLTEGAEPLLEALQLTAEELARAAVETGRTPRPAASAGG